MKNKLMIAVIMKKAIINNENMKYERK